MCLALLFFDTVGPSLGRVDYVSLPQQALTEMVIEGMTSKENICGDHDGPKDIEEWKGVEIEDGEVAEIKWYPSYLEGLLNWNCLPSSVKKFVLTGVPLILASLPTPMEKLILAYNSFTGSIDLENFSERMKYLSVSANQMSADPMEGHLFVVGWTSTPSWGKPGAF